MAELVTFFNLVRNHWQYPKNAEKIVIAYNFGEDVNPKEKSRLDSWKIT